MQSTFKLNWVSILTRTPHVHDLTTGINHFHENVRHYFKLCHFALPFLRFFKCGSRNSRLFSGSAFRFWIDKNGQWLTRIPLRFLKFHGKFHLISAYVVFLLRFWEVASSLLLARTCLFPLTWLAPSFHMLQCFRYWRREWHTIKREKMIWYCWAKKWWLT